MSDYLPKNAADAKVACIAINNERCSEVQIRMSNCIFERGINLLIEFSQYAD